MKNLRDIRKRKKLTQVKLGIDIGITQEMVSSYERDNSFPYKDVLIKLADYFNTSVDYLIGRTDIQTPINEIVSKDLRPGETNLIEEYRKLNSEQKNRVLGFILGMQE